LLSGFEKDRAERIIEEFEASEVLFGIGDPPTNPDFLDRNEEEQDMLLTKPEIDTFNFPAGSVDGTRSVIQELIHERLPKKHRGRSTEYETVHNWCMESFAPHFEIQMTYSVPGEYNYKSYSTGIQDIYIDKITDINS